EMLIVKVESETDGMLAFAPVEIGYVLILRVAPEVRHEVFVDPYRCQSARSEKKPRPAALDESWTVGARDLEKVQTKLLVQPRLLRTRVNARVAEICVDHEFRTKDICSADRGAVCAAVPLAGVRGIKDRRTCQLAEQLGIGALVAQDREAHKCSELFIHIPV